MVYAVKKIPSISASRKLQNKKACGARLAHRRCGFTLPNRYPLKTRKKTKRLPTNVRSAICKQAQPAGFVLQKKIPCHKREWTDKIKTEPGTRCASRLSLVPVAGLEPARCRHRWILSPLRLPIPSHWHMRRIVLYISFPIKSSPNFNFFAFIFCFSLIYMIQI